MSKDFDPKEWLRDLYGEAIEDVEADIMGLRVLIELVREKAQEAIQSYLECDGDDYEYRLFLSVIRTLRNKLMVLKNRRATLRIQSRGLGLG